MRTRHKLFPRRVSDEPRTSASRFDQWNPAESKNLWTETIALDSIEPYPFDFIIYNRGASASSGSGDIAILILRYSTLRDRAHMRSQNCEKYRSRKKCVGNFMYAVRTGHGIGIWYFQSHLKVSKIMNKHQGHRGREQEPSRSLGKEVKLIALSSTRFLLRSIYSLINRHFPSYAIFF